MIRLAISKGRILEQAVTALEKVNILCQVNPMNSRRLIIPTNMDNLEIIVIKASDVPVYIDSGKIDLGIVGLDTLMEDDKNNHFRLRDMTISKCKLAVAGKAKTKYFNNMKVATKYPNIAKKYFENIGFQCSILELYGSIELAPVLGLSDFIVDIVETGKTLKENGLRVHDTITKVSSLLIANRVSYKIKRKEINSFVDRIKL
jgi:ATP phosphoribosyltransferase|tara:strand:+ start:385 stop:993 length:609 start_codon:yes stop_codon:yes gene_type:complete